jgi:DNA polymerase-3 subunit epsilon
MANLTFIDVETTGLSPKSHEILEIGALEVDRDTLEPIAHLSLRIQPQRIHLAEPRALQINGYTPEGWVDAVPLVEGLSKLAPLIANRVWVGHNPKFDRGFIEAGFWACDRMPPVPSDYVDTKDLAKALQDAGAMKFASLSLANVSAAFGLVQPAPHRAYDDAKLCWEIVRKVKNMRGGK